VLQGIGPTAACSWLAFTKRDGTSLCWLAGEPEGELAAPPGWTPARSAEWDRLTAGDPSRWVPVQVAVDDDGAPEEDPRFGGTRTVGTPFEDGAALRALIARSRALAAANAAAAYVPGLADVYRRASALNPSDAELAFLAAHHLDRESRTDEGLAYVERALELDPKHSRALTQKGYVLGRTGHPQEALALLRRAVEVDPSNSSAWSYKAREERYAKLVDDAREWLEKLRGQQGAAQ